MKEQAIKKINKMGKVANIITTICKVCVIIGIVGALIGTIVCAVLPADLVTMKFSGDATVVVSMEAVEKLSGESIDEEELRKELFESGNLSVDGKDYDMTEITLEGKNLIVKADAEKPASITLGDIAKVCGTVVVLLAVILVTLFFIGNLCKAFRDCQTPFEENVIKKMTAFAYSLIPMVIVEGVAESVTMFFMGKADGVGIEFDPGTVIVVLVIFALVYVFKYGAMLQQESDETL